MSIPSLCQVRINEYKISENKTSTFTHNELERKIQEIFNESIVQHLISTVSTERVAQFQYSLVNAAMEGKNFGDITIAGKNGNYSLSQHVQYLKVMSPSKESEETLAACTRIESMVRELMDSLRSKEEDPSKALAGRIKELELENESLKKQTALLQAWKAGSRTAIAGYKKNALIDSEELKRSNELFNELFKVSMAGLVDAKSWIDELNSDKLQSKKDMETANVLIEELEGKLESTAASKEQLQEAQRALSAAKKQIKVLEDLNSKNKTSKQMLQSANLIIAELQEKLAKGLDSEKKLQEASVADSEKLKTYDELFQVYKAKLDDAKRSIDGLTSANTRLEEAMLSKTDLIEELEGKFESANSLIAELQAKLAKGLDTEKNLQEASVSANKQICDQRKTIKAKSDEIARLKKTLKLKDTQQIEASAVLVTLFRELEKLNRSSVKGLDPIINKFDRKIRDLSST